MKLTSTDTILVTGATGFVGSHVVEHSLTTDAYVRAFVRPTSNASLLERWNVPIIRGDFDDTETLEKAVQDVTVIVHCAAKVGDWGRVAEYRRANVDGLERLVETARTNGVLKRFVHMSSLGVYPARDHFGTDETISPSANGYDGYTLTKAQAEQMVNEAITRHKFPAVILRPGFIYGPRDRTIFPKLLDSLHKGYFTYLGASDKLLNNTYVGNLVQAIFLAVERDDAIGKTFNIRDGRLVDRKEFITGVCEQIGFRVPKRTLPLEIARPLTRMMEGISRLIGKKEAPLLSQARIKFLALNLDFSIEKARRELGYHPAADFREAIVPTMEWFREEGLVP